MGKDLDPTDHDLLIGLVQDMGWLKEQIANHLNHHWALTIALMIALVGAVATIIGCILT
jgi:hypothetical protein